MEAYLDNAATTRVFPEVREKMVRVMEEGQEDRYEDTDIMVALDTLEEKERKVIMLKVFEEWTIREIADCLHENPNTVKSMLYRGLKKLRGKVEAEMV